MLFCYRDFQRQRKGNYTIFESGNTKKDHNVYYRTKSTYPDRYCKKPAYFTSFDYLEFETVDDVKDYHGKKDGRYKRYLLSSDIDSILLIKLLKSYYPSLWNKWSDKLAEIFLSLIYNAENKGKK